MILYTFNLKNSTFTTEKLRLTMVWSDSCNSCNECDVSLISVRSRIVDFADCRRVIDSAAREGGKME